VTSTAVLGPVEPQPAPSRSARRAIATLVLFAAAVTVGVGLHVGLATPAPTVDRYPTINRGAPEPAPAAAITRAIVANDPKALATSYSAELLQAFHDAVAPLVDVDEIRYAGGVEQAGETLASYVATGKDQQGQSVISGFVIHVQNGAITGFN
jgi:hypothetical protein